MRFVGSLLRRYFLEPWRAIDAEADAERRPGFDPKPLVVAIAVCVGLTLQEYVGDRGLFNRQFRGLARGEYGELLSYGWWTAWRVIGYVLVPLLAIAALPGERIRDYYVSLRGVHKKLWIYGALFALILPAVVIASQTSTFGLTYPFYKHANRSLGDLVAWEVLYAIQFLSLEFFFRGFMLKALKPRFGSGAIFVMVIPYCMIHYGKPMAETYGAIVAGVVLGTLAMRTRSIWGGVLIHVAVALTMDLLALQGCPPPGAGKCPGH